MASNRVLWLVRARARQSDLELWNSRTSKSTWRLALAEGCFGPKAVLGKACFAADLCFKEIHVDARAGDVMAARGAGGAAGPAPSHQPSESGKAIYIYCDYSITFKHAGSVVVKAAGCYAHYRGFVPSSVQFFFVLYFLFMEKWNCTCHVCTWYIHGLNMYEHQHKYKYMQIHVYT